MSVADRGSFSNAPNQGSPSHPPGFRYGSPGGSPLLSPADSSSLTVNYLPTKFGAGLVSRKRHGKELLGMPKQGGGRDAFKANEPRMPGASEEDYDGTQGVWFGHNSKKPVLRWTRFKWIMFVANIFLTIYSMVALIFCLLTWFLVWDRANVVRVGNTEELIVSTIAASLGVVTSLVGWAGILLNNRGFLAWYTFLLWICFAFLVAPGYITYRKRTFNLEGKLNRQWSQSIGAAGRLSIQNQLECCGYFSPFVLATVSQTCYARSILPGCKGLYMRYERIILRRWFTIAFALVPLHLFVMTSALLCSNHVTYRFGKGMTPKAYRLDLSSMAVIMDSYADQLVERYGNDVASEIIAKSRSNLHLDALPDVPYDNRH
ncbi:hypothetical protein BDM02DRAFT_3115856 [Thelephora ganbajun]|uniref:Uncharacterized protein n=1 Tax=Thelephora ganbajun TaxID=370292 RepID=A0ACB6ZF57_THEGA|nr:hypothetical protein BDM02DRAFT_3115856 [Thelephora ganbajun]